MNDDTDFCNYHPHQLLVGVCPLCLNDKLLILAAIQDRRSYLRHRRSTDELEHPNHSRKPSNGGLLAFGSLLSRFELRRSRRRSNHRQSCDFIDDFGGGSSSHSDSPSLEDSFISIKFEEHGVSSWNANATSVVATDSKDLYKERNGKSEGDGSHRWRKRIGQLLQLVKRKRFKKPNGGACHDSSVDGLGEFVKVMNMR